MARLCDERDVWKMTSPSFTAGSDFEQAVVARRTATTAYTQRVIANPDVSNFEFMGKASLDRVFSCRSGRRHRSSQANHDCQWQMPLRRLGGVSIDAGVARCSAN